MKDTYHHTLPEDKTRSTMPFVTSANLRLCLAENIPHRIWIGLYHCRLQNLETSEDTFGHDTSQ